ncbi:murein hydrolase activator EnvC [Oceanimonas marisflavi]|uniref:murein hydrolase activator EnvC n=1 Tax=Oceanimonas marisflavi TaxID=2059724 RepID=UPI000D305DA0|nr:murein hydrolase activator EnvC [Oceanimonas marisflavi]
MGAQRLIVSLLLSTGLMAGACAWADDSKDLKNVKGQIASQQQDIQAQQRELKALQQQLAKDEKAISALARELNQTQNRLKDNERKLARLEQEHQSLNRQADEQRHQLATQLRAAYQNGRHDYLKLLLNGQNSSDIDRLLHYYAHLNQARADALHRLADIRRQLADNRRQAEQSRAQLKELLAGQQQQQQSLQQRQHERNQTAKKINARLEQGNRRLANLKQAASHLEQQIKAAAERARREQERRERERREQERLAAARTQPGPSGHTPVVAKTHGNFGGLTKGSLPWPLKGSLLHRFGAARTSQLNWKGLLIGAPAGREVSAVANGQVVYADWLNGFGMVMVIDHGKGYLSLYGHNQSLLLNAGDKVRAGQAIALSGESGGQEKPGLYFEIRYRGQAIDPLPWLQRG